MRDTESPARQTAGQPAASQFIVQDYLDTLLRDAVAEARATPTGPKTADDCAVPAAEKPVVPPQPSAEPSLAVPENPAAAEPISVSPHGDMAHANKSRVQADWADQAFASLLFDVAGLKLAAPLHKLGGIMPMEDKLQPVVAQASWFMGLMRWNDRTIRVIDTARFVMPERLQEQSSPQYCSIVVLGDSNWALAVNDADQSVILAPDDIRWRKTLGKRPWLAGTVLNRLCALLDVDVLIDLLDASDAAAGSSAQEAKRAAESGRGTDSAY